jgi:glutamate N-acetyltransferase/amino-acid N-acetyltransferase
MALMMVADGEGATKVMRLSVEGADTNGNAEKVARTIADSLLVKTAMHGGDPNWGRIASSAGAAFENRSLPEVVLELCGIMVMQQGVACPLSSKHEAELASGMRSSEIDIKLSLGLGQAAAEIFFADIGHDYVTINADYHN